MLDLRDNALIVDYDPAASPIDAIRGYLTTGYAGGAWNGVGINSSTASSTPGRSVG